MDCQRDSEEKFGGNGDAVSETPDVNTLVSEGNLERLHGKQY